MSTRRVRVAGNDHGGAVLRWLDLRLAVASCLATIASLAASAACAVAFLPLSDAALRTRADVIVHGVVVSTHSAADALGRAESISVIHPVDVLKGRLPGDLVLHQLGGTLPDGSALDVGGRPEYEPGTQVLVFAIARPEGDYQTAEMLLGKFEIFRDASGTLYALPALAGTDAKRAAEFQPLPGGTADARRGKPDFGPARELVAIKRFLREESARRDPDALPVGKLQRVRDAGIASAATLKWSILSRGWRWNNGATAAWVLDGSANVAGGGITEAAEAIAAWTDDPSIRIAYTLTADSGANRIHLSAATSPCGWDACIDETGGVMGCGAPTGAGSHVWRGDTYTTITAGEVWLRPYCTPGVFSTAVMQSVLGHELGHTLGLGHSDEAISPHDVCIGDEHDAIMLSASTGGTTLGSDDTDALRWLYGDAANSCGVTTLSVTVGGTSRGTVTSVPRGIACPETCSAHFAQGTVVALTAAPASGYVFAAWSANVSDSANTLQVTMSANRAVVAAFDDLAHPEIFPRACAFPTAGWVNGPPGATAGWDVSSETSSEGICSLESGAMRGGAVPGKAQVQFAGMFVAGNITFDRRVSSEAGYDCLRFLIDGVAQDVQGSCTGLDGFGASGEVPWSAVSIPITSGAHTLLWSYEKDATVSPGVDAAWIDNLALPLSTLSLSPPSWSDLDGAAARATSSETILQQQ